MALLKLNEPPYKLQDIFQEVVDHINSKLRITGKEIISKDLKFRYGYVDEMIAELNNETSAEDVDKRFPFLWLVQPFTIIRGTPEYYGEVKDGLRLFIIMESQKTYKAFERESATFDPFLNPIYIQLLKSMKYNRKIDLPVVEKIRHEVTPRYNWAEDYKLKIPDHSDCIELNIKDIFINNNQNCN